MSTARLIKVSRTGTDADLFDGSLGLLEGDVHWDTDPSPTVHPVQVQAKESSFSDISLTAILAGDHPSESVKVRHCPLASENLTITRKQCKKRR